MNDAQRVDHLGIDENGEELPDHRERKQGL